MDIINYKGGRALFIDTGDLMKMDTRTVVGVMTPVEVAVRHILENKKTMGVSALIIVTSFRKDMLPKFLRDALSEETSYVYYTRGVNCFRNQWSDG